MFPKQQRLPLRQLPNFFQQAKTVQRSFFFVYWQPNTLPTNRFAVIVSKKTAPLASQRNVLKRRFRAAISQAQKTVNGIDFAFVLSRKATPLSPTQLHQEIEKVFHYVKKKQS